MKQDNAAEAWYRVTAIKERERKLVMARLQADVLKAKSRLQAAEHRRQEELQHARTRTESEGTLSAAALSLMSDAMVAGRSRVDDARTAVTYAEAPMDDARVQLSLSARERLIAEKWLSRRREEARKVRLRKLNKQDDDLTACRLK